jgi:hypothetical protein
MRVGLDAHGPPWQVILFIFLVHLLIFLLFILLERMLWARAFGLQLHHLCVTFHCMLWIEPSNQLLPAGEKQVFSRAVYNVYVQPLSSFPGPKLW